MKMPAKDTSPRSLWSTLLFALPALPITMMHIPVGAVIPGFYAKYTAVSLGSIGGIFLISRIFDAVIDPAIGHLSDGTATRIGPRKPWVLAGALIASVAVYVLFTPPATATTTYLLVASMALYLGWTVLEIPYRAWSAELSRDYAERSRISTYIAAMGAIGTMLFMGVSLLPIFKTAEITPATLHVMALLVVALLFPLVLAAVIWTPAGRPVATSKGSVRSALASLGQNGPLKVFSAAFIFGGLATGVFTAVFFVFVDSYLHIGQSFTLLYVVSAVGNLVAMPAWHHVSQRWGKHIALGASWFAVAAAQAAMLLVVPGPAALVPMLALSFAFGVAEAAGKAAPYALLGDVVDYEILRSGVDRAGGYFAVLTLVAKLNFAIGGGVAFLLLGASGYRVGGPNSTGVNTAFLVIFIALPTLLWLLAGVTVLRFPLDRRRQDLVRRRIETTAGRRAALSQSQALLKDPS